MNKALLFLLLPLLAALAASPDVPPVSPGGWPFTFAETLTLITTVTASVATLIGLFRIEKVHTIVNSNQTKQEQKIADLQSSLTSERTINALAEGVRQALAKETAENLAEKSGAPPASLSVAAPSGTMIVTIPETTLPVETADAPRIVQP